MRTVLALLLIVCCLAACDRTAPTAPTAPTAAANAEPVALHFKVTGMMCEGCEQAITEAVKSLPGVVEVKAVHATGDVDVRTADPSQRDAIAVAIKKLNYEVAE